MSLTQHGGWCKERLKSEIPVQEMIRAALRGEPASIRWPYGPAEILYGKDAAKGTVLAVLKEKVKDKLFHIGNGELVGGDEILSALKKQFPEAKVALAKGDKPMPYPEARIASDYFRRHIREGRIFVGFDCDDSGLGFAVQKAGRDPFLFASDFPHEIFDAATCRHEIDELLSREDLTQKDKEAVLGGNALRLYRLAT